MLIIWKQNNKQYKNNKEVGNRRHSRFITIKDSILTNILHIFYSLWYLSIKCIVLEVCKWYAHVYSTLFMNLQLYNTYHSYQHFIFKNLYFIHLLDLYIINSINKWKKWDFIPFMRNWPMTLISHISIPV